MSIINSILKKKKELFNTTVQYDYACNVLNNDGIKYEEYGRHDDKYDIDAIFYTGYKNTKVFAYIGIPKNYDSNSKLPAVICLHGGLGKADIDWVEKWNDMGFIAIAPDLYGDGPEEDKTNPYNTGVKKHPYAGVFPWDENGFLTDYENSGMYQNLVNVIYAHNLLESISSVDKKSVGIMGISWGGVTSGIVSGIDDRLSFAVLVYGCGYLYECKTYFKRNILAEDKTKEWDPAVFLANAKMPIMYINSDSDEHFSLNSTTHTYNKTKNGYLSILNKFIHTHEDGRDVDFAYDFAKNMVAENNPYIKIASTKFIDDKLVVEFSLPQENEIKIIKAYYLEQEYKEYASSDELNWKLANDYEVKANEIEVSFDTNITCCYVSVIDKFDAVISTPLINVL